MSEDSPSTRIYVRMGCTHICAGPTVATESWVVLDSAECCRCYAEHDDRFERKDWCRSCQGEA